jgi:hypothetical protein
MKIHQPTAIAIAALMALASARVLDVRQGSGTYPTVQSAAAAAQPGDTVLIHAGIYRETVTPARSGTGESARIVFMPYQNDIVTIDGSDTVSGWTLSTGAIFKAAMNWDLGAQNQVFVNDTMAHLARWPNIADAADPFFNWGGYATCDAGSAKDHIIDNALPAKPDNFWQGCTFWAILGVKWTSFGTKITSSSGNNLYYSGGDDLHASGNPPWGAFLSTDRDLYFLAGKLDLLDTVNEWYYDNSAKLLYLRVAGGGNPGSAVKAKHRQFAFNLTGKSYITIRNIRVFASTITMENASHCVLDGINARYISHHSMDGVGCYAGTGAFGAGGSGITVSGNYDTVKNCVIKYSAGSGISVMGSNQVIDNNDVQYTNYIGSYCEGIHNNGDGANVLITRNKVWYAGGPLIDNTRMTGTNDNYSFVFYNDCAYGEQIGDDRGGINGNGSEVAYNWVHDIGRGLAYGTVPGLYTDGSLDYTTYHHNVVWNLIGGRAGALQINNTAGDKNGNQGIFIYNNTAHNVSSAITGVDPIYTEKNDYINQAASNFVNATANDFHLVSTASAVNTGEVIPGITDGYAGSNPDKGAYEYNGGDAVSTWRAGLNVPMYYTGNGTWVAPTRAQARPRFKRPVNEPSSIFDIRGRLIHREGTAEARAVLRSSSVLSQGVYITKRQSAAGSDARRLVRM